MNSHTIQLSSFQSVRIQSLKVFLSMTTRLFLTELVRSGANPGVAPRRNINFRVAQSPEGWRGMGVCTKCQPCSTNIATLRNSKSCPCLGDFLLFSLRRG